MSKVVYFMSVSVDGFVETRDGKIDWTAPSDELHRLFNDYTRHVGAFLYGTRSYELMASFWPTADQNPSAPEPIAEFARMWRRMPKVVFSKTLQHVDHNSRLAGPDIQAEVAKLKEEIRGDLGVCGATLAASFMRLGLVDEYRLFVRPIVLGGGKPYFPPLDRTVDLRLVETRTFSGGVVLLRYEREATEAASSTSAVPDASR